MTDYKVNLPKTKFPMKANLARREPEFLKFWNNINLYQKILDKTQIQTKFTLHDGPIYANGNIHIGHAANRILKDIIVKSRILDGFATSFIPGWDCHGLPIELQVEKKIGKKLRTNPERLITECRKYAESQIESQSRDFKRLGVIGDWQNPYKTLDFKYEADILRALAQIIANGYVTRGYKPVHWCIACGSALAEAEVEHRDKTSPAIDVRFRVISPQKLGKNLEKVSIPIWTTTPWTLSANEAVALHPDYEYLLVDCSPQFDDLLIIVKPLLEITMQRYGIENYRIIKSFQGNKLEYLSLRHPFLDKTVPVILGEHVTIDTGTGAVHTAPAHGQEDYVIGKIYNLPIKNPVGANGKFLEDTQFFAGENVFDANDHVIEVLRDKNNLIHATTLSHSYPHCWRHKTPLIFRATEQWFISLETEGKFGKLRERALNTIKNVNWIPERGFERMKSMIEQRPDWCISRQRLSGTPIPLFTHKQTQELHPQTQKLIAKVIEGVEKQGIVFWYKLNSEDFLKTNAPQHAADNYQKSTDTLDVWFDAGVSHYCVVKKRPELQFPSDLYIEGSDQYRGWFQSSLLTALALYGETPYKTVASHGFTVDAEGHKMSKSLGNVIAPQKVMDTLGADIIRLWIASTYIYNDLAISEEILQRNIDAYRTLRNTARFLLGNLHEFNPETDLVEPENMLAIDRFAVTEFLNLQNKFKHDYTNYHFYTAYNYLESFITVQISSFYFSIIKDRLYTMPTKSLGRRSAQTALLHILEILVRIFAPVLSFTAEEIWQEMRNIDPNKKREQSVFLTSWYRNINAEQFDDKNKIKMDDWQNLQHLRAEIYKELEKLRAAGKIGSSLEADVTLYCNDEIYDLLEKLGDELRFILITSTAEIKSLSERSEVAIETEIPGLLVEAKPSPHQKCCRCWHYRADVGEDPKHPELCSRCVKNVESDGEMRIIA